MAPPPPGLEPGLELLENGAALRGARMVWAPGQGKPGEGKCKVWRPGQRAGPLPVLLFLPGSDGKSPMELTKLQRKWNYGADVTFYNRFIVVSPGVCTGWQAPPYSWLLSMCEAIKQQRPGTELLLMGVQQGRMVGWSLLGPETRALPRRSAHGWIFQPYAAPGTERAGRE